MATLKRGKSHELIEVSSFNLDCFLCDHSLLSSGQMKDARSRCQHGKEFSVYLQYCKCCTYFVIQLSSEPDKQ